jgi:hypothetical protein
MKSILAFSAAIALAFAIPVYAQDATTSDMQVYQFAGVPSNGTSEIDTLTIATGVTAGTFTIAVTGGRTTNAITWSATNATLVANVDAALENLNVVGVGGVTTAVGTMTAGIGTITLTFTGKNAKMDFPALTIASNNLTGAGTPPPSAVTLTTTTPGVDATCRTCKTGQLLVDNVTPSLYINTGTQGNPTWTKAPN